MKLWIDDVRPAPDDYVWVKTVNDAKERIVFCEDPLPLYTQNNRRYECPAIEIELIDIDHDAGEYAQYGGDYIRLLDWLEETGRNYPIRIHSMNPVGVANMRAIIRRNGWKEVH